MLYNYTEYTQTLTFPFILCGIVARLLGNWCVGVNWATKTDTKRKSNRRCRRQSVAELFACASYKGALMCNGIGTSFRRRTSV